MAHIITANDGENYSVFDEKNLLELVERYAGNEISQMLEELLDNKNEQIKESLSAVREIQGEYDDLCDDRRQLISDVYDEASWLLKLVADQRPKRSDIKAAAMKIWRAIYNEL